LLALVSPFLVFLVLVEPPCSTSYHYATVIALSFPVISQSTATLPQLVIALVKARGEVG